MQAKLKLTTLFEPNEARGYLAHTKEIPGVNARVDFLDETKINLMDALSFMTDTRVPGIINL